MDWKNWRDYIPCSSRPAAKIPQTKEIPRDVSEEEFREDLNLTAEPEGTTAFKRKNVMIGLGVVAMIFTCAFIYGISTASTANKHKAEADQVEAAEQASHLKDAPKSYADDKNRQYEKPTKQRESGGNEKISRLHDDGHVEYARPVQRSVPAYTPIPQSTYRPRVTAPVPNVSASVAAESHGGLTPQQKLEAEKAKEKMAANESPIGFSLKEEK